MKKISKLTFALVGIALSLLVQIDLINIMRLTYLRVTDTPTSITVLSIVTFFLKEESYAFFHQYSLLFLIISDVILVLSVLLIRNALKQDRYRPYHF